MQTKLLFSIFMVLGLYSFAQVPAFVPTNGLLVYYPFNGNYNNVSGSNVDHLTNAGGVSFTTDRNGVANSSANFSGNSNSYLNLPTASFSFSNSGAWSAFYYIRRNDPSNTIRISLYSGSNISNAFQWALSSAVFGCQKTGGTWTWSGSQISNSVWDFIAVTYNNGAMKVYKNGSLLSSATYPKQGNTLASRLILGSNGINSNQEWKGQIDDLAMYNRELSSSEISSIYNQCSSATQGGSISGPSSVCSGINSSTLNLSGHSGNISKWQTSSDTINWSDVSSSSGLGSITVNNLTSTRYYRAVVTKSNCPTANSPIFTISTSIKKWNGNSNNQFSNASNWCGGVPTATELVEIQNVARVPQLTESRTFGGLILNGNLDLNGNQITINGPVTGNGGFVSHANSTIILGSTFSTDSLKFADNNPVLKTLSLNSNVQLKLNKSLIILDSLLMNNGKIVLGNNHLSARLFTQGSTSNYVQTNGTGKLFSSIGTSTKTLPVGNSSYNPITLSLQTGTDSFGVSISDQIRTLGTSGTTLTNGNVQVTWDIQRVAQNGSPVNLSFSWNASQEQTGFTRSLCYASHFNSVSQAWEKLASGSKSASGTGPYQLSYTNYSGSFSPFGVGSGNGALPVELLFFNAEKKNQVHLLTWATASEKQFSHFEIQQSFDGKSFQSLDRVISKGGSTQGSEYEKQILGNQAGKVFYRLAMVDLDGTIQYSSIRVIQNNNDVFQVYPNPTTDQLNVKFDASKGGLNELVISNLLGQEVVRRWVNLKDGVNHLMIPEFDSLPKGTYLLTVSIQGEGHSQKFIKP